MTVKLFDKWLQTNFHFYHIRHKGVTNTIQYNIYISASANVSCIYGLVLASKQFCGFSRHQVFLLPLTCGGRAREWGKSGTLPEVRENRVTKFWRCSSEFQIWRVEAFWFPHVKIWERRKSDRQTKNTVPTQADNNSKSADTHSTLTHTMQHSKFY